MGDGGRGWIHIEIQKELKLVPLTLSKLLGHSWHCWFTVLPRTRLLRKGSHIWFHRGLSKEEKDQLGRQNQDLVGLIEVNSGLGFLA